jgi:hypothetical protein
MLPLTRVRVRLTTIWLLLSAFIFTLVIIQSVFHKYDSGADGDHTADMWKWLLPNLLPTLTTMIAAVAASWSVRRDTAHVRRDFYRLTVWLSLFYLLLLLGLILCQPIVNPHDVTGQIKSLQNSNLGTGPIQGLVASSLGVLFASGKRDDQNGKDGSGEDERAGGSPESEAAV